jgi:hypothetical protein
MYNNNTKIEIKFTTGRAAGQSAYEAFISPQVKICTQWTTKTLNISLKDSICFLAITYGKTYLQINNWNLQLRK